MTFVGNNAAALLYLRSGRAKKGVPRVLLNPFGSHQRYVILHRFASTLGPIDFNAINSRSLRQRFQIRRDWVEVSRGAESFN